MPELLNEPIAPAMPRVQLSPQTESSTFQEAPHTKSSAPEQSKNGVSDVVRDLGNTLDVAVSNILKVNSETKVLALNARIEAARAGAHGAAFSVVAQEIQRLSEKTSNIAGDMASKTRAKTSELMTLITWHIRGARLADLALMNIDLIDRCLYERTCDVRWWATDSAVVDALAHATPHSYEYATRRLGVILKAYTVYLDLVLADHTGIIMANGRPDLYEVAGYDVRSHMWFTSAMATHSGDDFGFQTATHSPLVGNAYCLTYSAAVREAGDSNGRRLGALGILFNWESLSQNILNKTVDAEPNSRCYIIDGNQNVLASSRNTSQTRLNLPEFERVYQSDKGYYIADIDGVTSCIAFALAPGFETYSTGWYSIIIQPLEDD